jgi:hypothetical protein
MFEFIIAVIVVVFVVAYYKALSVDQKKVQGELAKDYAATGTFATGKIIKELGKLVISSGQASAKYVQDNHDEVIKGAKVNMDQAKAKHGGSARKLGVALGTDATKWIGVDGLNDDISSYLSRRI